MRRAPVFPVDTMPRAPVQGVDLAMAIVVGCVIGLLIVLAPIAFAWGALAVVALFAVVAVLRWPQLGPAVFWLVFSVQHTVFYGFVVQGLYYPIYLLMGATVALALLAGRLRLEFHVVWPYLLFLFALLISLQGVRVPLDGDSLNRMFVYVIGFLVFFQFVGRSSSYLLMGVQVVASMVISGWVVLESVQAGFVYRGGIEADQNYVSFIVGFGVIALLALLMGSGMRAWLRVAAWIGVAIASYALLLLASRGVFLAIIVGAIAMYARILLDARRSVPIFLMAIVAAVLLLTLPGSDALLERLSESNLSTANDRLPLWTAAVDAYMGSNLLEALFGQGFEASKPIVSAVASSLTSTHNAYLQMLVELGLFGLVAFVLIHVTLIRRFLATRAFGSLYGLGAVLFMMVSCLSLNIPDSFVYWVAIGYLMALALHAPTSNGTTPRPDAPSPLPSGTARPRGG